MDTDERDIFQFLKTWGAEFTNAKEVARRAASKKKFYDDPDWAKPILMRMEERGILESDIQGRYRIKPVSKAISPTMSITNNCNETGLRQPADSSTIPFKPRPTIQNPVRGCAA